MSNNWNQLNLEGTPVEVFQDFADGLSKKEIDFPDFSSSDEIFISCDYSGEHKESNYFAVSFIISGYDTLNDFDNGRLYIRKKHNLKERTFAYKKVFHDKIITRGLTGFLRSIDTIPGVLLTFSINKEVESLFTNIEEIKNDHKVFEDWNLKDLGKLLWTVHLGSFFISGLSREGQNVFWLSDNDNIVANHDKKVTMIGYFGNILNMYLPHSINDFGLIVPQEGEKVLRAEDLLSIPDLAGGAVADIDSVHREESNFPKNDTEIVPLSDSVKEKSSFLANWLGEDKCPLQKLFFRLEYNSDKTIINYNRTRIK